MYKCHFCEYGHYEFPLFDGLVVSAPCQNCGATGVAFSHLMGKDNETFWLCTKARWDGQWIDTGVELE